MTQTLLLHNDVSEVSLLAGWVEGIGEQLSLSPGDVFQLNLALEEAVVNVMHYAYPGETGRPVRLEMQCSENSEELLFVLEDDGIPFDPTLAEEPDVTLDATERPIGGLGIFLVSQIMKEVSYRRCDVKNILLMRYNLNK